MMTGPMAEEILSDFEGVQWCQDLLRSPDLEPLMTHGRLPPAPWDKVLPNTFCNETLRTETTFRAWTALVSREKRADCASQELYLLLSLGDGLGGFKNHAHGGLSGLILDQATGMCASLAFGPTGVTAESWLKFKRSISIPSLVLCRTVVTRIDGRRARIEGTIEDGSGTVYTEGGSVYVLRKQQQQQQQPQAKI